MNTRASPLWALSHKSRLPSGLINFYGREAQLKRSSALLSSTPALENNRCWQSTQVQSTLVRTQYFFSQSSKQTPNISHVRGDKDYLSIAVLYTIYLSRLTWIFKGALSKINGAPRNISLSIYIWQDSTTSCLIIPNHIVYIRDTMLHNKYYNAKFQTEIWNSLKSQNNNVLSHTCSIPTYF